MCITGKTFPEKKYFMSNSVKQNFFKLTANKRDTVLKNFYMNNVLYAVH